MIVNNLPKDYNIRLNDQTNTSNKSRETGKSFWDKMADKFKKVKWNIEKIGMFGMSTDR